MHFSSTDLKIAYSQKYLGLLLDSKLNFNKHILSKITKGNKIIRLRILTGKKHPKIKLQRLQKYKY